MVQRGRCCQCDGKKTRAVTIKGMNQSDGVTQWEYGPGAYWRQQHGGSAITGFKWDGSATLNKFAVVADSPNVWITPGTRSGGAFTANACQPLEFVTLDADDGTETAVADCELFCSAVTDSQFTLVSGYQIRDTLTLSDGDYLIVGARPPALEWVDYTTDTANKEYVLHAHIQQAGNVYLRTKTSSETITLAYNASASDVAAAFNATADCTACTATGGPWPHRKIELSVTWSVSTGDISHIKIDDTYTVTGGTGTCLFDWVIPTPPDPPDWVLVDNSCTFGATPTEPPGSGPGTNVPGTCVGGSPPTTTRNVAGCAATYDVTTGLIETSVGYVFGRDTSTPSKLVTETGSAPSFSSDASLPIGVIAPGDSGMVCTYTDDANVKGKTVEGWTPGTPWVRTWQKYNNVTIVNFWAEGSYVGIPIAKKAFTGGSTVSQVRVASTTGSVTEYNSTVVTTTTFNNQNWHSSLLMFDDQSKWVNLAYEVFTNPVANNQFGTVVGTAVGGSEVTIDGTQLKLGMPTNGLTIEYSGRTRVGFIGATASNCFGLAGGAYTTVTQSCSKTPTSDAGGAASVYSWNFYAPYSGYNGTPTQFRFVFRGGTTSWLDWDATDSEIATAILAVYPENSSGTSNVSVNPFGITANVVNTIGPFERRLEMLLRGAANATGLAFGFPPRSHFDQLADIRVEFQNATATNTTGISCWDSTDGSQVWARNFGTSLLTSSDIIFPRMAWLYDTLVIAYGEEAENELP